MNRDQFARQLLMTILLLVGIRIFMGIIRIYAITLIAMQMWVIQYYYYITSGLFAIALAIMVRKSWQVTLPLTILTTLLPEMGAILYLIIIAYPVLSHESKTH